MFCHHCGKSISAGKFCHHCGKDLLSSPSKHVEEEIKVSSKNVPKEKSAISKTHFKLIGGILLVSILFGSTVYGFYVLKNKFDEKNEKINYLQIENERLNNDIKNKNLELNTCREELGDTKGNLDTAQEEKEKAAQSAKDAEAKASQKEEEANKNKQIANQKAIEAQKANTQFNVCSYYLDLAKQLSVLLGTQKGHYKSAANNITDSALEFVKENYDMAKYYANQASFDISNAEYYEPQVQGILNQFK